MSKTGVKSIKGFHDILPEQSRLWRSIEKKAEEVFSLYGFHQIIIPTLEYSGLFEKGVGMSTDIVEKEMYSFADRDRNQSLITLRPEGTAGVVRAFIENSLDQTADGKKVYYSGSMFRRENTQKGRMREFHQIGAEFFGSSEPSADAEIIAMLWHFFKALGIESGLTMEINSIGTPEERGDFKTALRQFLEPLSGNLCNDCQRRLQTNPLRVLDCKKADCERATGNAPVMKEYLSGGSAGHFEEVKKRLNALSVPFTENGRIVRGLDYYTHTVFEVKAGDGESLGAQNTVAAGGRYDRLVEELGGRSTPAVGFAIGVERTVDLLQSSGREEKRDGPQVFVCWIGVECFDGAFELSKKLRDENIGTLIEHSESSIKSQTKKADKSGARFAVIIGAKEKQGGTVKLKNMETGDERDLPEKDAVAEIVKAAKR